MAKASVLTEAAVAKLKPAAARREVPDGLVPGLYLVVQPSGVKSWAVRYRLNGKPAKHTIGRAGVYGVARARDEARTVLLDVRKGRAPAQAKADEAAARPVTFGDLARDFLAAGKRKKGTPLRPATVEQYRRCLTVHAAPLRDRTARDIRRGEIAKLLDKVEATAGRTAAAHVRAALSRLFAWALSRELVEGNPVAGTESIAGEPRERKWTNAELAALWTATDDRADFNAIIRLALWTGCRRTEIAAMRWSEIDLRRGVWTVPHERMKARAEHVVALPRQAVAFLRDWPQTVGKDSLFGTSEAGFSGFSAAKRRLDARLGGAVAPWTVHDLRRATRTGLSDCGVLEEIAEACLAHVPGKLIRTYNQPGAAQFGMRRDAWQSWADRLEVIVAAGDPDARPDNVVALRG